MYPNIIKMQIIQDDSHIHTKATTTLLVFLFFSLWSHTNVLFIIEVKILFLLRRSYKFAPLLCWLMNLNRFIPAACIPNCGIPCRSYMHRKMSKTLHMFPWVANDAMNIVACIIKDKLTLEKGLEHCTYSHELWMMPWT